MPPRAHNSQSNTLAKNWRDADGQRAVKDVDGSKTVFFNVGTMQLEEYSLTNAVASSTIYEPEIDSPLAEIGSGGSVKFYHQDFLGSVILLTDSNGGKLQSYTYDVWGKATGFDASGSGILASAFASRFLFTAREYDVETGLYHYRARVYSPAIGRFLQTDPIDFEAEDVNLFRYVSNNPTNFIDSLGLAEHTSGARPSTSDKHQKGQARQKAAQDRKATNPQKSKAGNPPYNPKSNPNYLKKGPKTKGPGALGLLMMLLELQLDDWLGPDIDPCNPPMV